MKAKIIGIFVYILLIITAISVAGSSINDNLSIKEASIDNNNIIQQTITTGFYMGDWSEQDKLIASDGATSDRFGYSVSIEGDYALIGAPFDDSWKGSAYVFKRDGSSWVQEDRLIASDGTVQDLFGWSVSIDGDYALIGAFNDGSGTGSAYVFKRDGSSWVEEDRLIASDGTIQDSFGWSVSIQGDYALIGAYSDDSFIGSAYVFKRIGSSWAQEDKLTASDGTTQDRFGYSVSIDGEHALIGAYGDDDNGLDSGSTYVFKHSGSIWTEVQKLTAADGSDNDFFGCSVSIHGDYALIGACGDDGMKGSAYVFKRSGFLWAQEDKLTASDGETIDSFGFSVSISGDNVVIGAYSDDSNKGSVYVFKRDNTTWTEGQKLTASDGVTQDRFGGSVSINGNNILIGAYGDESEKGAAYIFKKLIPDLDCLGSLNWEDITPGDTVIKSFMIANIGESGSELNWEIESYPIWGTWTFVPQSGTGLTPEMGTLNITVEVVAPNEKNKDYNGDIKVVNSEDSNDYDIVQVTLSTPRNKATYNSLFYWLYERFPLLEKLLSLIKAM